MRLYRCFILTLFLAPLTLSAQITISGKVTSLVNKKGIPDASVFLSNSRSGTKTEADGAYNMYNVKDGQYDMVVSCIGYETYHKQISVRFNNIKLPDIELMPRMNQLAEVKIHPSKKIKRDFKRENYVQMFTEEFLGHTKNAGECKILNPDVLNFEYDDKTMKFTATTNEFLIIENNALGYRIKYLVNSFLIDRLNGIISYTGSSVFEQLPRNDLKQVTWQKNRAATYKGSAMHFLRSCIADAVSGNYFTVFELKRTPTPGRLPDSIINTKLRETQTLAAGTGNSVTYYRKQLMTPQFEQSAGNKPLKPEDFVKLTDEKGVYDLNFENGNPLMVNYKRRDNSSSRYTSYIIFVKPDVYFDSNGVIFTPMNTTIEGYWATLRVGDLLPVDYEVGK